MSVALENEGFCPLPLCSPCQPRKQRRDLGRPGCQAQALAPALAAGWPGFHTGLAPAERAARGMVRHSTGHLACSPHFHLQWRASALPSRGNVRGEGSTALGLLHLMNALCPPRPRWSLNVACWNSLLETAASEAAPGSREVL